MKGREAWSRDSRFRHRRRRTVRGRGADGVAALDPQAGAVTPSADLAILRHLAVRTHATTAEIGMAAGPAPDGVC